MAHITPYITLTAAARIVPRSTRTLRRAIEKGDLSARRRATGRFEVRGQELARWAQSRGLTTRGLTIKGDE